MKTFCREMALKSDKKILTEPTESNIAGVLYLQVIHATVSPINGLRTMLVNWTVLDFPFFTPKPYPQCY